MSDNDSSSQAERRMAVLCHLSGLVPVPVLNLLGPWLCWKLHTPSQFVKQHASQALNFQLGIMIANIIAMALLFFIVGFMMLWGIWLLNLVFVGCAAIKAHKGVYFKYPFSLKLIN